MIIQIRGTSGSGKSTVVRRVMDSLSAGYGQTAEFRPGRKQPLFYTMRGVMVLGHYETTCGGCDTIGSARAVYDLICELKYGRILCEGLLLSEDTKWSLQLPDLRVIFLTTPLEQCLTNVEGRRREAGNDKPLDPANTTNRVVVIERARIKLTQAGVYCCQLAPEQAVERVLKWLRS